MDKKLLAIFIVIPIASIVISGYIFNLDTNKQFNINIPEENKDSKIADTFFNQVKITSFSETGHPKSKIIGHKIAHYPGDTESEIDSPEITLFRKTGSPVDISAKQGWVNQKGNRVRLKGQTSIKRKRSQTNSFFQLETPELIIWPNKNFAETDKAVKITTDTTIATGIGMKAYLDSEHYYLLNNVKIQHLPKKPVESL